VSLNYHIGRFVLSSLSSARVAGWSLQHGHYSNPTAPNLQHTKNCRWITTSVILFSVRWVAPVLHTEAYNTGTTQTQPHQISNTQRTEKKTTDVVIQRHSRKLLMMDTLMSKTCWVHKKWNKIASDIKSVFYSSTITTMHGPINIRYVMGVFWVCTQCSTFSLITMIQRNVLPPSSWWLRTRLGEKHHSG